MDKNNLSFEDIREHCERINREIASEDFINEENFRVAELLENRDPRILTFYRKKCQIIQDDELRDKVFENIIGSLGLQIDSDQKCANYLSKIIELINRGKHPRKQDDISCLQECLKFVKGENNGINPINIYSIISIIENHRNLTDALGMCSEYLLNIIEDSEGRHAVLDTT